MEENLKLREELEKSIDSISSFQYFLSKVGILEKLSKLSGYEEGTKEHEEFNELYGNVIEHTNVLYFPVLIEIAEDINKDGFSLEQIKDLMKQIITESETEMCEYKEYSKEEEEDILKSIDNKFEYLYELFQFAFEEFIADNFGCDCNDCENCTCEEE